MFSGFWGWFLVVVIVAVIFGAGKLPDLKVQAEEKLKLLASAAEKGKKELAFFLVFILPAQIIMDL